MTDDTPSSDPNRPFVPLDGEDDEDEYTPSGEILTREFSAAADGAADELPDPTLTVTTADELHEPDWLHMRPDELKIFSGDSVEYDTSGDEADEDFSGLYTGETRCFAVPDPQRDAPARSDPDGFCTAAFILPSGKIHEAEATYIDADPFTVTVDSADAPPRTDADEVELEIVAHTADELVFSGHVVGCDVWSPAGFEGVATYDCVPDPEAPDAHADADRDDTAWPR